jgi:ribosomal protein L11 methylase PrmA
MKIKADVNGFIESYATFGNIVDSTEIEMPMDLDHFEQNYRAYRIKDGKLFFDENQAAVLLNEEENAQLRVERDTECFSVINRGWLWYDTLTDKQTKELQTWYKEWLDVTETKKKPKKPAWLD